MFAPTPPDPIELILLDLTMAFYRFSYPSLKDVRRNGVTNLVVLPAVRMWLRTLFIRQCFLYEDSLGKVLFTFIIGSSHTFPERPSSFFF